MLIKNVIVYKAKMPSIDFLRERLEENQFVEIQPFEAVSTGFVDVYNTHELVTEFEGGYAFALRIDRKIIPGPAVKTLMVEKLAELEANQGYKPGRLQRREVKQLVIDELIRKGLVGSTTVVCYYDEGSQFLIVPTSSQRVADTVMSDLIRALDHLETTTIHYNGLSRGLSTMLGEYIEERDESVFGPMKPTGTVVLQNGGDRVQIKTSEDLFNSEKAILEALEDGYTVRSIAMSSGEMTFTLNESFKLTSVKFESDSSAVKPENPDFLFHHDAGVEVFQVVRMYEEICGMFNYVPKVESEKHDSDEVDPAEGL